MNMLATIIPKSDQLNADDLIGRTMTITVTKVVIVGSEQPVSLNFEGDDGKPFRPGKSMRRVLVKAWGADANKYIGRSMTLYRDDSVKFGGMEVGGIRISHMTDIDGTLTMALTETKGKKKPFVVRPLAAPQPTQAAQPQSLGNRTDAALAAIKKTTTLPKLAKLHDNAMGLLRDLEAAGQLERRDRLVEAFASARGNMEMAQAEPPLDDSPFPGDIPMDEDYRGQAA